MTHHEPDGTTIDMALELLTENGFEGMSRAIEILLSEAMKLERSAFLEAGPYERSEERRGYANGYREKRVKTRLGELELEIPRVRGLAEGEQAFYPKALERGERSERALKLALAQMWVEGVSTRKVTEITRELCGLEVTSSQVSRAAKLLDEEIHAWRTRSLGEYRYLILDARYEKVRHGGSVVDCAVLLAAGVGLDGKRTVLGVSVALSEAEVHWRAFLEELRERGLFGVQLITSDDHSGLRAALRAVFPGIAWQRCQFHLQQNAQGYVPRIGMRKEVARTIRDIFNAPDKIEAERLLRKATESYRESAPNLASWMEENIPEGLTAFEAPPSHRRRLRTSNLMERLNREIKRRTRVATLFPNEASLLRLVSAVVIEIAEDWETGRIYLSMDAE
jgi:putative transposase